MEVRPIPAMDKLFRRRRYVSATVQHNSSAKINLVHRAMDKEIIFRSIQSGEKGAHENDTGKFSLFMMRFTYLIIPILMLPNPRHFQIINIIITMPLD